MTVNPVDRGFKMQEHVDTEEMECWSWVADCDRNRF